jgi:uncharacterized protein YciI
MAFFFVRLLPKRPDFPANLTAEEGAVMQAHSKFLGEQLAAGTLIVAGPVLSPTGSYGVAVFEVESREAVDALLARDPAVAVGTYDVSPMAAAVARPRS